MATPGGGRRRRRLEEAALVCSWSGDGNERGLLLTKNEEEIGMSPTTVLGERERDRERESA